MKDLLIDYIMNNIRKYKEHDESKLKIIRYGLASLYLHLTKLFVVFILSYIFGLTLSLLKFMIFYSILRLSAFGLHAKKSLHCWITSLTIFLGIPYLCEKVIIPSHLKIILMIICFILLLIYAPADTEKRPLINKKKRIVYKIITLITTSVYITLLFFIKNNILENCIVFAIALQTIFVLPITYKLFGVSYKNYEKYSN